MFMKNENEKKGLFARLNRSKNSKKRSCCGSIEIEEVPEDGKGKENEKESPKSKGNSCCGN